MAGYTAREIVDLVKSGTGPHSLYLGGDSTDSMAKKHYELVGRLRDARAQMRPHWKGKAADAAYAGVGPLIAASEVSGEHLGKAQGSYSDQGDSFGRLEAKVGDGLPPKPESNLISGGPLQFLTSRDEEIEDWNAEAQHIVDAYNGYSNDSRINSNRFPDDYGELKMPPGGADFSVSMATGAGGSTGEGYTPASNPTGGDSGSVTNAPGGSYGGYTAAPTFGAGGVAAAPVYGPGGVQVPAASASGGEDGYVSPGVSLGAAGWAGSDGTSTAGYTGTSGMPGYGTPGYGTPGYGNPSAGGSGYGTPGAYGYGPGGYGSSSRSRSAFGPDGSAGAYGYAGGGYRPGSGFGPQGSGLTPGSGYGAGSGAGSGYGAGRSSAAAPMPKEAAFGPVRGGPAAAGVSSSSGGGRMMPLAGAGGRGNGDEDETHETPEYLQEPDIQGIFGPDPNDKTVPPVIGL